MKLVIDANIPAADHCFAPLGRVIRLPGREITAQDVRDADALIVRSITRVDEALLAGSRVRFVGSCTIGVDHVDTHWLAAHGIGFANAPGCNAEAVVDYVLSNLVTLGERQGWSLFERRVGVVGAGNVGARLVARLQAMGIATQVCDPPRAEREGQAGFVDLDTLITTCDVICLHVPLVRDGAHATRHLLDEARIKALSSGCVLINAGRGDCVDGAALTRRLESAGDITAVLDVWESEPGIDAALRDQVALATPHIAGHSLDGKLRGTFMIHEALMAVEGEPARLAFADICPPPALAALELRQALSFDQALALCVRAVYDVRRDHEALARAIEQQGVAQGFDACRTHYPLRREFATLEVRLAGEAVALEAMLHGAGFRVLRC